MIEPNRFDRFIIWLAHQHRAVRILGLPIWLPVFFIWWHTSSKKWKTGESFLESAGRADLIDEFNQR